MTARPVALDTVDAVELAEMLGLLVELCERAPNGVALSLWVCGLDTVYPVEELASDLERFATMLGDGG
jgi:hypothetical protein